MATLESLARNAACDALAALHNGGTLEVRNASNAVLATLTFSATAFGAASAGVATGNAITAESSTTAGTATNYVTRTSGSALIMTGTVGTSGADMIVADTTIPAGATFSLPTYTITVAA